MDFEFEPNVTRIFLRFYQLIGEDAKKMEHTEARFKHPEWFIDSLIHSIPTQHFCIDGGMSPWILLDGNKRLNAVKDFLDNKIPLPENIMGIKCKGWYKQDFAGTKHSWMIGRIRDFQLEALVFLPMDVKSKLELRKRILGKYENE